MSDGSALWQFTKLVAQPEDEIDLAHAALLIAANAYPDLDVEQYRRQLDRLAAGGPAIRPDAPPPRQIDALSRYFARDLGFRGNRDDYYDPRNSFLNDVLDRRTGIPITLSVVYLAIGRRLGLPLIGIGLPGHFVVALTAGEHPLLVDPFNGGAILDDADVAERLAAAHGAPVSLRPEYLRPLGPRAILFRMLNNLKAVYLQREELTRALDAVNWMLAIEPTARGQILDRGLIQIRAGRFRAALADLRSYASGTPAGQSEPEITRQIEWLETMISRLN